MKKPKKPAQAVARAASDMTIHDGEAVYLCQHFARLENSSQSPADDFDDLLDVLIDDDDEARAANLANELIKIRQTMTDDVVSVKVLLHLITRYDHLRFGTK